MCIVYKMYVQKVQIIISLYYLDINKKTHADVGLPSEVMLKRRAAKHITSYTDISMVEWANYRVDRKRM